MQTEEAPLAGERVAAAGRQSKFEADGDLTYERDDGAVLSAQRERQGALESTGLIGVRWGWPDLFNFGAVSRRLTMAFARGARRGSAQRRWGVLLPQPTPALHS